MNPFQREILELIAAHDGEYSWYQLDRALTDWSANRERNLSLVKDLPSVLRGLEAEGLVSAGAGHAPSQPLYAITTRGRRLIADSTAASLAKGG